MRRLLLCPIIALIVGTGTAAQGSGPINRVVQRQMTATAERIERRFDMPCTIGISQTAPNRWQIDLRCYPYGR